MGDRNLPVCILVYLWSERVKAYFIGHLIPAHLAPALLYGWWNACWSLRSPAMASCLGRPRFHHAYVERLLTL